MRKSRIETFAFFALLLSVCDYSEGIDCYDCFTNHDKTCKSPSKSKTRIATGCDYCLKLHQILMGVDDWPSVAQRACMMGSPEDTCENNDIHVSLRTIACKCKKNLCNSAPPSSLGGVSARMWATAAAAGGSSLLVLWLLF